MTSGIKYLRQKKCTSEAPEQLMPQYSVALTQIWEDGDKESYVVL